MNGTTIRRIILSKKLAKRDGLHCHYCGISLVPSRVFQRIERGAAKDTKRYRDFSALLANGAVMATLDHKIPESRGGRLILENVVLACEPCNMEKGSRDYCEFVQTKRAAFGQTVNA